jgi:hypothetical protein
LRAENVGKLRIARKMLRASVRWRTKMNFKTPFIAGTFGLAALAAPAFSAEDTIKVGVLHSLSGTMAISETTLKDTMLMLIDE